jgi:hypothetical protein
MPVVLIIAFAASLGAHALALFGPDIDLSTVSEPPPLLVELKAPPAPPPPPPAKSEAKAAEANGNVVGSRATGRRPPAPAAPLPPSAEAGFPLATAEPVPPPETMQEPMQEPMQEREIEQELAPAVPATPLARRAPVASALPARGLIRYRVDRGDQGFQIGFSIHEWEAADGTYRITAVTETTGLVAFFKPLRIEVESRGRLTAAGLVPEHFVTRREGRATGESAEFDWDSMQLRMGNRPVQALSLGAQDLLSYAYQLGLVGDLASVGSMPIATGKKYANFQLEVVGDEDIEIPAGTFRSVHLRVPGVATTELWLARDRALLPVKIQHVDRKGNLYVQVATAIEFSQEP